MCDGGENEMEFQVPTAFKDQLLLFFFQTFIEKLKAYTGSVFRKAVSHTNGGHGRHLPPELRMFSSQI